MNSTAPNSSPPPAAALSSSAVPPLQTIPGLYGWPVVGPIEDRLDYFWFQGQDKFFQKRTEKYKSTVFRTNVPPCFPFFAGVNPNVVADKRDALVGDFVPSVGFTGNLRTCAY